MPQTAENLLYVYIRGLLSNGSLSRYARILFGRVSSSFFLLQILRRCLFLQNQFNECDTYTNKMKCMARFSVSQNDCNRNQNDKNQMAAISREQCKATNGCKTHHRQTIMDSAWFQKAENHSDTFAAILWSKNYDETMFGSGGNSPDAYGQNFQTTLKRAMGPHWVIWFRHRLRLCWWAAREREREQQLRETWTRPSSVYGWMCEENRAANGRIRTKKTMSADRIPQRDSCSYLPAADAARRCFHFVSRKRDREEFFSRI